MPVNQVVRPAAVGLAALLAGDCTGPRGGQPEGPISPIDAACTAAIGVPVGGACTDDMVAWKGTPIVVDDQLGRHLCQECLTSPDVGDFCAGDPWGTGSTECPTFEEYLRVHRWCDGNYGDNSLTQIWSFCHGPGGEVAYLAYETPFSSTYSRVGSMHSGPGLGYEVMFDAEDGAMLAVGESVLGYIFHAEYYDGDPLASAACCGGGATVFERWYGTPPAVIDCDPYQAWNALNQPPACDGS